MKEIKELSKRIKEELEDAEWYAKAAIEHKIENPELAETYHHIAREEVAHSNLLHDRVVALIRKAADKNVPAGMREMWNWQHEEIIEEQVEVKHLIEMYSNIR